MSISNDQIKLEIETQEKLKKTVIRDTAIEFSKKVETLVWESDITYMEAIISLAEEAGYEFDKIAKLLTEDLKAKLGREAEDLSLIKKTNRRIDEL